MLAGIITGFATNEFINMSLFLAFAIAYPEFQIMIFFVLPVKVKYLAILYGIYFLYMLIYNSWGGKIALLISLINIALFFGGQAKDRIVQVRRRMKWKKNYRKY
jgi:hypothetical protein